MKEFKAISAFLFWMLRRKFHAKHKIPSKEKIYTTEFNLMNVLAWLFENCIAHVLQMGSNVRSHSIVLKWMNAENIYSICTFLFWIKCRIFLKWFSNEDIYIWHFVEDHRLVLLLAGLAQAVGWKTMVIRYKVRGCWGLIWGLNVCQMGVFFGKWLQETSTQKKSTYNSTDYSLYSWKVIW